VPKNDQAFDNFGQPGAYRSVLNSELSCCTCLSTQYTVLVFTSHSDGFRKFPCSNSSQKRKTLLPVSLLPIIS